MAQHRGSDQPVTQQMPPIPLPRPDTADHQESGMEQVRTARAEYMRDIAFSGFEPFDEGSRLFRRWIGTLNAARSDGENFSLEISMLQNDMPMMFGDQIQNGLKLLMTYKDCKCKPSRELVCELHIPQEEAD